MTVMVCKPGEPFKAWEHNWFIAVIVWGGVVYRRETANDSMKPALGTTIPPGSVWAVERIAALCEAGEW